MVLLAGNATLLLVHQGKIPLFAFEEAIGYMCSPKVPDKDGISAAVHVCIVHEFFGAPSPRHIGVIGHFSTSPRSLIHGVGQQWRWVEITFPHVCVAFLDQHLECC